MAECFLLPLDEALLKKGIRYVRYVDDIRIFGATELEVQQAAVALEVLCRDLGLIPQGGKFSVLEAKSIDDAIGVMPSIVPPDQTETDELPSLTVSEADSAMLDAVSGRPYRITNKTKARYVLYRAPPTPRVLDLVLRLLPRHPEHTDAICSYLRLYRDRKPIERCVEEMLRNGTPYDYVRGELWMLLAETGSTSALKRLVGLAAGDLRSSRESWHLRYCVLRFIIECRARGIAVRAPRWRSQPELIQGLLVPHLPSANFRRGDVVGQMLRDRLLAPGIMIGPALITRGLTHRDLGVKVKELHESVQNVFRAVALIKRRYRPSVDPITEVLAARFGSTGSFRCKALLGKEYQHCLRLLKEADNLFDAAGTTWLQRIDAFNDAVVRRLLDALLAAGMPGGMATTNKKGQLIDYGVLLQENGKFDKQYSKAARPLRDVHKRRNKLPQTHPYDKKSGKRNRYLIPRERTQMRTQLALAYTEIGVIVNLLPS